MRVWIDPDRLAALNLAPGDVHAALQRNNYLAAVGQTKGNQVQVNLLANTDLRSVEEFSNLIVADRDGAIVRLSDVARVELGAEEATLVAKYNDQESVYLGVWPLVGANEIDVASSAARGDGPHPADAAQGHRDAAGLRRHRVHARRAEGDHQDADRDDADRRRSRCSCSWARSARRWCRWWPCRSRCVGAGIVMYAFGFSLNLLTILAIVLSVGLVVDDAIVVVENVERHVREGKSRDRGGADRRPGAGRSDHRDDDHPGRGVHADRLPGRAHRLAVPGVRHHAGRGGRGVRHRGGHALAGDELALRARARQGGPADRAGEPRLRRGARPLRAGCSTARSRCAGRSWWPRS